MNNKETRESAQSIDSYVLLARRAIEEYLTQGITIDAPDNLAHVEQRSACFVSIHHCESGELRGCIGTLEPTQKNLLYEIIQNAISAATKDPRFPRVDPAELKGLCLSVDVLSEPEPATQADLDPSIFGVIVSQGYKRGVLLPALEGIDSVEMQLEIACSKAGINSHSAFEIQRFTVERHL